jgi:hypothetical protein
MDTTMNKNEKISAGLKKHFTENAHWRKGKDGTQPHSEETKAKIGLALKGRRRTTEKQRKARNKANVYAYRARKYNAIVESSDLQLIKKIYENCPDGYHVDHIQALASGGLHHQDNLQYLEISENCRKGKGKEYDTAKAIPWQVKFNPC